jgi:WXG100 family type VII secretion target
MAAHHRGAVAGGALAEPGWAEIVDQVICDGRPGYLRDAADRYEQSLRRMHDEATTIEDELNRLADSWDGTAYAAYRAAMATIVAQLRRAAGLARAIADALRLAADTLRAHQARIPVPVRLGREVFRAHHQRAQTSGGVAPSNADFEQAIYADILEREPWLAGTQGAELARALFHEQQNVARRVYRELSAAYGEAEALLPGPTPKPTKHASHQQTGPRHGASLEWSGDDPSAGGDGEGAAAGEVDPLLATVLGGNHDARLRSAGSLSGSGNVSGTGSGPGAGAGWSGGPADTGAAFGMPVSVVGSPGGVSGMSMGTGTHLSTPMGAGHGGVIGVIGDGDTHSTWLTEDDPFEQDGQSSGAVLS